ncbi:GNAT family N-acetyltransferase [Glycomyces luteolus]|uniref:GNAT family N-acetyltransferase n=1 Tax=Glycomyces luteolus TaxID=2670330 RepID=A0A9X3PEU1_9ACTN|nr:GNAT family N-acetyltransferase [Glycomyces luteolus]MDA1362175.1 GNAT family N-acetyltransferase [Glycomyces luteolus]
MSAITIRRAGGADLEALVPAYAAATADEATNAWVASAGPVPEDAYAQYLTESLRDHLTDDEVWVAERDGDIAGISVWRQVVSADQLQLEADRAAALAESTGLAVLRRAETALRATGAAHPDRFPHLYLYLIAVAPEHRGAGAGGAMLRERLAVADRGRTPAYLEASTEDSARLYKRCGFEETGERIQLPEGGPRLIPMWREPAGS